MFSKSRINEPGPKQQAGSTESPASEAAPARASADIGAPATAPKAKPPASVLSSDLAIVGNLKTTGDIQVEGTVEGDIRAHLLTVGEGATVKGEIVADDVVVNGRVIGRVRGLKVRLTSTARVEGDIIHKTIAIESGAHFEGSVQRADDPLSNGAGRTAPPRSAAAPQPQQPAAQAARSASGESARQS
ncbi:protein CcmA, bactofilin family [Meinhardsimonia xiamenensis]|jgi:cytoskeletal protein CcmA (bactofilin family)|uniref:Protein CcmA, bactofilin family n=1 Tax=Meinhardsimonia xiamenensis TaxID=990712 RepID=A0A1G9GGP5_9RHOB|nr:polymer-forming cytoskeletal protein [Meinhardsimonia xiamenensis]PRX31894.1 cytoskeletal protein CcmA (bactofilin family) [Meinhardsimonia xiamenensis]SDK99834.1 protein CcmA, bactofilin family [Meinhardsimonia xiamenensis]